MIIPSSFMKLCICHQQTRQKVTCTITSISRSRSKQSALRRGPAAVRLRDVAAIPNHAYALVEGCYETLSTSISACSYVWSLLSCWTAWRQPRRSSSPMMGFSAIPGPALDATAMEVEVPKPAPALQVIVLVSYFVFTSS